MAVHRSASTNAMALGWGLDPTLLLPRLSPLAAPDAAHVRFRKAARPKATPAVLSPPLRALLAPPYVIDCWRPHAVEHPDPGREQGRAHIPVGSTALLRAISARASPLQKKAPLGAGLSSFLQVAGIVKPPPVLIY
jgi:hypothetical protein